MKKNTEDTVCKRIRNIEPGGQLMMMNLPTGKIESIKTMAYRLQYQLGCRFRATADYKRGTLIIERF